jgi:coiled-coil domain-containing protein 130
MQGFNMGRYVPPDLEGTTSANKIHKKRAPGTLRKDGTQTVRFECPFAVWCHTCSPHAIIGQGVRFNAVKAKVGHYYSTPIWSFKIKHPACGGTIEIRTDPKNTAYVVTEGGKARDYGDDKVQEGEGGLPILTAEERERRRDDAFAELEGKVEDKQAAKDNAKRIQELYHARDRDWDDTWSANKRLRTTFRQERKVLKAAADADEALKDKLGTSINLLPATEEDERRAKLIAFGDVDEDANTTAATGKALFEKRVAPNTPSRSTRPAKITPQDTLRRTLLGNTRAAMDPFGSKKKPA